MRKFCLPMLLILSLLLTGCAADSSREAFDGFIRDLAEKESLSFSADLRCEYSDKSFSFTVDCLDDGEGCAVSVTAPELIQGITARMNAGETTLEYGSVRLDTGPLDSFGLCPMSAMPLMLQALKNGYVDSVWEEDGQLCALIVPSDSLEVQLWVDKYSLEPVHAQLISEGRVAVYADIKNWV